MNFSFWKKKPQEEEEEESKEENEDQTSEEENIDAEPEVEMFIIASEGEKKAILASFDTMRRESLFCDVAFICNGVLFRAHKVVLSSWSRWMRAFLCDSPSEEVLSLDIFTPDSFRSVLDYMYGHPLHLNVETADSILKVVRRLELQKLEQQCWRYLMTGLDTTNCAVLHELADKYDCPPLKLAAWKMLQTQVPDMDSFPSRGHLQRTLLPDGQRRIKGTGLTGPGDPHFATMGVKRSQVKFLDQEPSEHEDEGEEPNPDRPSVFDDFEDEDEDDAATTALEDLDPAAPATEVIMAWARRLKAVYATCVPIEALDDVDMSRLRLDETAPNVKMKTIPRDRDRDRTDASAASLSPVNNRHALVRKPSAQQVLGVTSVSSSAAAAPTTPKSPAPPRSPVPNAPAPMRPNVNPTPSPAMASAPKQYSSARNINWPEELERFYIAMNMPEKVGGIKTILNTWAGKEDIMLSSLIEKYESTMPKSLLTRLEQLHLLMETATENSFNVRNK